MCPFKQRDMSVMPVCQILCFNFDFLHTVRSSWPDISTKIIEEAPSDHLCLLCKSRKRASVTTDHVYATFEDNSASILRSIVIKS